jgi:hypothetical protein
VGWPAKSLRIAVYAVNELYRKSGFKILDILLYPVLSLRVGVNRLSSHVAQLELALRQKCLLGLLDLT